MKSTLYTRDISRSSITRYIEHNTTGITPNRCSGYELSKDTREFTTDTATGCVFWAYWRRDIESVLYSDNMESEASNHLVVAVDRKSTEICSLLTSVDTNTDTTQFTPYNSQFQKSMSFEVEHRGTIYNRTMQFQLYSYLHQHNHPFGLKHAKWRWPTESFQWGYTTLLSLYIECNTHNGSTRFSTAAMCWTYTLYVTNKWK